MVNMHILFAHSVAAAVAAPALIEIKGFVFI